MLPIQAATAKRATSSQLQMTLIAAAIENLMSIVVSRHHISETR